MPKEDYLIKYLEKLSRVIAAMIGLNQKGEPEQALVQADDIYNELLNLNSADLATMSVDALMDIIRKSSFTSSYIESLAAITYQTGFAFDQKNNPGYARSFYQKSLHLYLLLNEKDKTFSFEREMTITDLNKKINS